MSDATTTTETSTVHHSLANLEDWSGTTTPAEPQTDGPAAAEESTSDGDPTATAAVTSAEEEKKEEVDPWKKEIEAFKTGYLEEKRKRQEMEVRLAHMEGRTSAQAPAEEDAASVSDDEFWADPLGTLERISDEKARAAVEAYRLKEWNKKATRSQKRARKKHGAEKYDALESRFFEELKASPHLGPQCEDSDDPAQFIVDYFEAKDAKPVDVESLTERIRAEERERILAELNQKPSDKKPTQTQKTLAGTRSATPSAEASVKDDDLLHLAVKYKY